MRFTSGKREQPSSDVLYKTKQETIVSPATVQLAPQDQAAGEEYKVIPLIDILPPEHTLRQNIDQSALNELIADIQVRGQLTPILVRPINGGKYELIAGLRRCIALDTLGQTTVKAIVMAVDAVCAAETALVENLKRSDINPVDESQYFYTLLNIYMLVPQDIATRIGKSLSYIESRLAIQVWDVYLKNALISGILNLTQCSEISRGSTERVRKQLYDWTIEMGANAKKIGAWRKEIDTQVAAHVAAGGQLQTFIPPADAPEITFICETCYVKKPFSEHRVFAICSDCFNLIQEVSRQGYFARKE